MLSLKSNYIWCIIVTDRIVKYRNNKLPSSIRVITEGNMCYTKHESENECTFDLQINILTIYRIMMNYRNTLPIKTVNFGNEILRFEVVKFLFFILTLKIK